MEHFQAAPIPESQKRFMSQLAHDFRAAISYVSFYPLNSPFVTQSIQKLHMDFHKVLHTVQPLFIYEDNEKIYANNFPLSSLDELIPLFKNLNINGVEIDKNISLQELTDWLEIIILPFEESAEGFIHNQKTNIRPFTKTEVFY